MVKYLFPNTWVASTLSAPPTDISIGVLGEGRWYRFNAKKIAAETTSWFTGDAAVIRVYAN